MTEPAATGCAQAGGHQRPPKVLIITGPTGVGKTAVGLQVAQQLGGEVVSADSVQVYRGLDIGSDKLPESERQGVRHHLLDVCGLQEEYSAGRFHDEGRAAIRDIVARGRVPVVVGGTGFYLRLLVEGKPAASRASPELEQQVEDTLTQAWVEAAAAAGLQGEGAVEALSVDARWQAGVALLGKLGDMEAQARIGSERNNYFRLKRALAMLLAHPGKTLRDLDVGAADDGPAEQYDFRTFFLYRPRNQLYPKVDARLQEMVLGGLLDEACTLLLAGLQPASNMASSAVGYRQAMTWLLQAALDVQAGGAVQGDLKQLVLAIASATHRLIRSQMTWFRDRHEYKWLNLEELGSADAATQAILAAVQEAEHKGEILEGKGYLAAAEQKDHSSREVQYTVLAARPQDVQRVMQHVQQVLVPQLLAEPAVLPALEAERKQRAAALQKQAEQEQQRQAKRQRRQVEKLARQARAKLSRSGGEDDGAAGNATSQQQEQQQQQQGGQVHKDARPQSPQSSDGGVPGLEPARQAWKAALTATTPASGSSEGVGISSGHASERGSTPDAAPEPPVAAAGGPGAMLHA